MNSVGNISPDRGLLSKDTSLFLKDLDAQFATLMKSCRQLRSQEPFSSHDVLEVLRTVGETSGRLPALEVKRQELLVNWASLAESEINELETDLREHCKALGWRVDGQWPKLVVERGIDLWIDADKQKIEIGRVPLKKRDARSVIEVLKKIVPTLLPKSFSRERFIEQIACAHKACSADPSDQIEILKVYKSLIIEMQTDRLWRDARASNFTTLTIEQFKARLSSLLELGPLRIENGQELRIFPPLHPKDALFVYQPAQQRYGFIGRIAFPFDDGSR